MEETIDQAIVVTAFEWLLFAIFVTGVTAWVVRIAKFFCWYLLNPNTNPYPGETLGLPKGAVRTFLVLAFTAITYLIFADGLGEIGSEDKKWFLTAYGTIILFYFGQKTLEGRTARPSLGIDRVYPSSNRRHQDRNRPLKVAIDGNGFETTTKVSFLKDGHDLAQSAFTPVSINSIIVCLDINEDSPPGGYDVTVELANGSTLVRKSGFMVEPLKE